jgi:hypothetical protein
MQEMKIHSYLPQTFKLVFDKNTNWEIEINRMGLTANRKVALDVAETLLNTL